MARSFKTERGGIRCWARPPPPPDPPVTQFTNFTPAELRDNCFALAWQTSLVENSLRWQKDRGKLAFSAAKWGLIERVAGTDICQTEETNWALLVST